MHAHVSRQPDRLKQSPIPSQLPRRLLRLQRRGLRLCEAGWDINLLRLLDEDAAIIATLSRAAGAAELAAILDELHAAARALLDAPRLPDRASAARLAALIQRLSSNRLPESFGDHGATAQVRIAGPTREAGFPLLVVPPPNYWKRLPAAHVAYTKAKPVPAKRRTPVPIAASMRAVSAPTDIAMVTVPPPPNADSALVDLDLVDSVPLDPAPADNAAADRDDDRRMRAIEPTVRPGPRADLLHHADGCLARPTRGVRNGALMLLVPADAAAPASDAAGHLLCALADTPECVADDSPGQYLLLDRERDPILLEAYALNLRDRMARKHRSGDRANGFEFDIGVCPFASGAGDPDSMISAARIEIDRAHMDGRHGVFVVGEVPPQVDAVLVEKLRVALEGRGLGLVFQPIVSMQGEADEQFQVLVRLRDEQERVYTASELIPAARHAGLLDAVDRWVVRRCIRLIAEHVDRNRLPRLFISQSLASVRDTLGPGRLQALLVQGNVDAAAIVVDLRAADVAGAPSEVRHYVAAIQAIGVSLALSGFDPTTDDALLDALSPAFVKLDPAVYQVEGEISCDDLPAILDDLHARGARVIAPHVENANGAAALWATGIDFIQGNFVQRADTELAFDFGEAVM